LKYFPANLYKFSSWIKEFRSSFAGVQFNETFYIVCGGKSKSQTFKSCLAYDQHQDQWFSKAIPDMPIPRFKIIALFKLKIYFKFSFQFQEPHLLLLNTRIKCG